MRLETKLVHGGPDHDELERLGLRVDQLVDFSVNTNPLGPSPAALAAAHSADLGRYPDRQALGLRRALAAHLGVEPDQVLVGNGSTELIRLLALAYARPAETVFVLEPTFGEYRAAAQLTGAQVLEWRAAAAAEFRIDAAAVADSLGDARPSLAYFCNPNNPTGAWLTTNQLEALLEAIGPGLLVVDEAYLELAGRESPALPLLDRGNLVLLRSMTKQYGLPGLRLGYAVAPPAIIRTLAAWQPTWSVSAPAQAAGLAALGDREHVAAGRQTAAQARAYLIPRLEALGYRCLASEASFWLIEVGAATQLRQRLLARGILVRDCTSFGLPGHIRLAARPIAECQRLIAALASD